MANKAFTVSVAPATHGKSKAVRILRTICGKRRIERAKMIGITPAWLRRSGRYDELPP